MKTIQLTFLMAFFFVASVAQNKETRNVGAFEGVASSGSYNIYLTYGNKQSVVLEGDRDDLEETITEVKGGILKIRKKDNNSWGWNNDKVDVHITTNVLTKVAVSGSGDIVSKNKFKVKDLRLSVSGSGDIDMDVEANDLVVKVSGSGDVDLRGSAESNDVSISGSGSLDAEDLIVDYYDISIAGSGRCRIHANKEIDSSIAGSGSIYYKGNPDKINNSSAGSGKIKKL